MKPLFIVLLIILLAPVARAQTPTFDEWFKQKKTQRKYLLQQIAELQIYLGYLKKGYDIARDGLYTIRSIKNGEWDLHKVFFGSLKIVNPRIRNYAKVPAIVANQQRTLGLFQDGWRDARTSGQLSAGELSFCYKVFDRLLGESERNLRMLLAVVSNAELEMTDDERLAVIDRLYDESQDIRLYITNFSNTIRIGAIHKARELDRTSTLKILHDIK